MWDGWGMYGCGTGWCIGVLCLCGWGCVDVGWMLVLVWDLCGHGGCVDVRWLGVRYEWGYVWMWNGWCTNFILMGEGVDVGWVGVLGDDLGVIVGVGMCGCVLWDGCVCGCVGDL